MIPLRDKTGWPRRRFPFINILLILANLYAFYIEWSLPREQLEVFIFQYGFVPGNFFGAGDLSFKTILPVFSSMYLHSGWLHLGSNMLSLWIFGDNVEDRMGHVTYLVFYTFAGVVAIIVQGLVDPTSATPVIGASGAIAGVMGSYMLLFPDARVVVLIPIFFFFLIRELSAFFFIIIWFMIQLISGIVALDPMMSGSNIAWWAHIGGFVAGMILAYPLDNPVQRR